MNWSIEEFNLGSITAFGDAKIGGFSGTKEQFYSLIKKVARGAYLIDIDKSTTTLDSGDWSNNQYDITSVYPTNKYKIFSVTLDYDNATSSQIDAWNNGDITLCDGNILKALGDVPLVDLPIVVVFQGLIIAVEVPVLSGSLVFDGTEQTPTFTGYDPNTMIMGGDTAETNAGDYTAAFTPRTGYMWSDGTTGVKFVPWSIAKAVVTAPTVTANLTYDGTEQTATVSEYDSDLVSVTGITGTNAGTYTATIALIDKANSEWDDHSTDDIEETWVINKAIGFITLSSNHVSVDDDDISSSVTASASGALSAISSDASLVTVTVNNGVITVTLINIGHSGSATISVASAESINYLEASATISVLINVPLAVSWHDGTDEQIAKLVKAADNGAIDLAEYAGWKVGDTREVMIDSIPSAHGMQSEVAQTIELVLMNKGGKNLVSPVASGRTECSFIVGMKDVLMGENGTPHTGILSPTSKAWGTCERRDWSNDSFRNSLPSNLVQIFKLHKNYYVSGNFDDSVRNAKISEDYFAIPSIKELTGSTGGGASAPENLNSQFEYLIPTANRPKSAIFWTRTRYHATSTSYSGYQVNCSQNGSSWNYNNANRYYGITLFGVI